MHFTKEDKAVIKNELEEFGWSAYKIWQTHIIEEMGIFFCEAIVAKYKKPDLIGRKPGSGRPRTGASAERYSSYSSYSQI